jgi:hypothetical protein
MKVGWLVMECKEIDGSLVIFGKIEVKLQWFSGKQE